MHTKNTIIAIFLSQGVLNASPDIQYQSTEPRVSAKDEEPLSRPADYNQFEVQMTYDYYVWLADACLNGKYSYRTKVAQLHLSRIRQEQDHGNSFSFMLNKRKLSGMMFDASPSTQDIFRELQDKLDRFDPWRHTLHEKEEIETLLKQIKLAYHLDDPDLSSAATIATNQEKCVLFMVFLDAMIDIQYPKGVKLDRGPIVANMLLHFLPAFEPVSAGFRKAVQQAGRGEAGAWHEYLMQVDSDRKMPWFPHSLVMAQQFHMLVKDWCSSPEATVSMSGLDDLFQYMDWDKVKYQEVVEYVQTQIKQYEPFLK